MFGDLGLLARRLDSGQKELTGQLARIIELLEELLVQQGAQEPAPPRRKSRTLRGV